MIRASLRHRAVVGILEKLTGGDRRSTGRVAEVVQEALKDPTLFGPLFDGMLSQDPLLRMRCADAVEKITATHPEYLRARKKRLIRRIARIDQHEVRWHVAQMVSRLKLSEREREEVLGILSEYLNDKSRIVRTFSMQALADLAESDASIRAGVINRLEELTSTGTPAMQSRGRKLLKRLRHLESLYPSHC